MSLFRKAADFWGAPRRSKLKTLLQRMPLIDLPRLLTQAWDYFRDPEVPLWRKLLGGVAVAYVVMPFDLIPDFIPVLGFLDDVGVVGLIATYLLRHIRAHAELTAVAGPPRALA